MYVVAACPEENDIRIKESEEKQGQLQETQKVLDNLRKQNNITIEDLLSQNRALNEQVHKERKARIEQVFIHDITPHTTFILYIYI